MMVLVFTDNVTLQIDGVLYLRILDPFKVRTRTRSSELTPPPPLLPLNKVTGMSFHLLTNCSQASYGVEDPEYAVTQLAQTTMRSELGKLTLDKVFRVTTASSAHVVPSARHKFTPDGPICSLLGEGVSQLQHRPLHQPSFRRVGDPLPPIRNQRYSRSATRQRVHADAGEPTGFKLNENFHPSPLLGSK